ncbi:type I 3-dehydroquinate dehydratase [Archaeoglobus sp.]
MKIVVSATSFADVVSAMSVADIIELRLDLFSTFPDERKLSGIEKPTIVTIRRVQEGGKYAEDERRRIGLLSKYSAYSSYVDLECDLPDDDFKSIKCKVIESYHNFKETPSYEYLRDLIESRRGDIFKIATMGRYRKDVSTITRVLCEYEDVVAFLMGENFAWTRIFACFLGSPFIYCSISKAVAPGQLNAKDVKKIFSLLR